MLQKIISGGQTGADRGAWDAALTTDIPIGGWVPLGRIAEDGVIAEKYAGIRETDSTDVAIRTENNVIDADGTLILSHGIIRGGTEHTLLCAKSHGKPFKLINLAEQKPPSAVVEIRAWLQEYAISVLNVAGPRHSEDPFIYDDTYQLMSKLFDSYRKPVENN
ncbi:MAG: putative molybdenum carrier protein [Motiliproteus sp.]|nr:putative molybdenum carrier protein [Motiliproteus sp.]